MKERSFGEVTRLPEEDLALMAGVRHRKIMSGAHFIVFLLMSASVLCVYLFANHSFFPGYPVVTARAERDTVYEEHYPPFRMGEWANYSIAKDLVNGRFFAKDSLARKHPVGFPAIAAPLVGAWGEAGPYFANAFILWVSALVFFFIVIDLVSFPVAAGATFVLAFATPNFFYAASAFSEPLGQMLLLVSLLLFLRGNAAVNDWPLYFASGFTAGLCLFVQPVLGFVVAAYIGALVMENGKWSWTEGGMLFILAGFSAPFLAYLVLGKMLTGMFLPFLFASPYSPYNPASVPIPGAEPNLVVGIWRLLLETPHGAVSLMPIVMLVPAGFIYLWRNSQYSLSVICGSLIATVVVFTAASPNPITGEGVGARQLLPIVPLLVLPLVFLWEEGPGEKAWLGALGALTVFMCTFGWWAGTGTPVEDRAARFILLARQERLERPRASSPEEMTAHFTDALKKRDMKRWMATLAPESVAEIAGVEREVFSSLSRMSLNANGDMSGYIESADPVRGVRLLMPNLNPDEEENLNDQKGTTQ